MVKWQHIDAVGWQLRVNNAGPNAAWTIRGTGGNEDMTSSFGSNDGNWHHYAGTYSRSTGVRSLYVGRGAGRHADRPGAL